MKTFTTSIFVPAKSKAEMNVLERMEMERKISNAKVAISDSLGMGALDDIEVDEHFTLVVNGEKEKHHIEVKRTQNTSGKARLMLVNPGLPEVRRFVEWRIDPSKIMSQHNGAKLQFKNFTVEDLRRIIRTAFSNGERRLVNYR